MENEIWDLLKHVKFPGMSRDIVSFGFVDRVETAEDRIRVELAISTQSGSSAEQVRSEVVDCSERAIPTLRWTSKCVG